MKGAYRGKSGEKYPPASKRNAQAEKQESKEATVGSQGPFLPFLFFFFSFGQTNVSKRAQL